MGKSGTKRIVSLNVAKNYMNIKKISMKQNALWQIFPLFQLVQTLVL